MAARSSEHFYCQLGKYAHLGVDIALIQLWATCIAKAVLFFASLFSLGIFLEDNVLVLNPNKKTLIGYQDKQY